MMQLPASLISELALMPDFDVQAFVAAHELLAPTSVRLHPVKHSKRFVEAEAVKWCEQGRYLKTRPIFTLDPLFHAGAYYVQEASSMLLQYFIEKLFDKNIALKALDLCAAPGGKSTLLASSLPQDSLLISNEVIRSRAGILEENLNRWGYMHTWVCSNDAKDLGKLHGYFDVVVADAPCSGSGLFRKDIKALDEWSDANVELCSQRQQRILADIWPALKENGVLIYSTCSYSYKEDEAILDWLIADFDAESIALDMPESWGVLESRSKKGAFGYRLFPHQVAGEGFFIAALRKKQASHSMQAIKDKYKEDPKIKAHAGNFLDMVDKTIIPKDKDAYSVIFNRHLSDWLFLKDKVYFRKTGVGIGSPVQQDWIPHHELALSIYLNKEVPKIEVLLDDALRYLKKEDAPFPEMSKGWYYVCYEGLGLGWVKNIGKRYNNYLPKESRIRMDIRETDW